LSSFLVAPRRCAASAGGDIVHLIDQIDKIEGRKRKKKMKRQIFGSVVGLVASFSGLGE
jgi:hypothetical protein